MQRAVDESRTQRCIGCTQKTDWPAQMLGTGGGARGPPQYWVAAYWHTNETQPNPSGHRENPCRCQGKELQFRAARLFDIGSATSHSLGEPPRRGGSRRALTSSRTLDTARRTAAEAGRHGRCWNELQGLTPRNGLHNVHATWSQIHTNGAVGGGGCKPESKTRPWSLSRQKKLIGQHRGSNCLGSGSEERHPWRDTRRCRLEEGLTCCSGCQWLSHASS